MKKVRKTSSHPCFLTTLLQLHICLLEYYWLLITRPFCSNKKKIVENYQNISEAYHDVIEWYIEVVFVGTSFEIFETVQPLGKFHNIAVALQYTE